MMEGMEEEMVEMEEEMVEMEVEMAEMEEEGCILHTLFLVLATLHSLMALLGIFMNVKMIVERIDSIEEGIEEKRIATEMMLARNIVIEMSVIIGARESKGREILRLILMEVAVEDIEGILIMVLEVALNRPQSLLLIAMIAMIVNQDVIRLNLKAITEKKMYIEKLSLRPITITPQLIIIIIITPQIITPISHHFINNPLALLQLLLLLLQELPLATLSL